MRLVRCFSFIVLTPLQQSYIEDLSKYNYYKSLVFTNLYQVLVLSYSQASLRTFPFTSIVYCTSAALHFLSNIFGVLHLLFIHT